MKNLANFQINWSKAQLKCSWAHNVCPTKTTKKQVRNPQTHILVESMWTFAPYLKSHKFPLIIRISIAILFRPPNLQKLLMLPQTMSQQQKQMKLKPIKNIKQNDQIKLLSAEWLTRKQKQNLGVHTHTHTHAHAYNCKTIAPADKLFLINDIKVVEFAALLRFCNLSCYSRANEALHAAHWRFGKFTGRLLSATAAH